MSPYDSIITNLEAPLPPPKKKKYQERIILEAWSHVWKIFPTCKNIHIHVYATVTVSHISFTHVLLKSIQATSKFDKQMCS